jgi:two-component system sensor histidine kinase ChvG
VTAAEKKERRQARVRRRLRRPSGISSITRRILAVNVLALAVLVVGLLYVGEYRSGLIESESKALISQAEMFAGALGESAIGDASSENPHLLDDVARQIVRRLSATTQARARLIAANGELVTDSRLLLGPGGTVQVESLAPPEQQLDTTRRVLDFFDKVYRMLWSESGQDHPDEVDVAAPDQYPEITAALLGETGSAIRRGEDGKQVLSVAVPVQRYKRVLGALSLSKDFDSIDDAVFQVRLDILKVFAVALTVTVLLSIYLAGSIARPIYRLAEAAERIRRGLGRQSTIPDFTSRRDEIGELSGALRDMTQALWQRMDDIEHFAADVAHEIKNPLSSLQSAVETAVRIDDPEQKHKLMAIIRDDIGRLDRLISDIATASRVDAELSRAEMEQVDVAGILETIVNLHREIPGANGAKLELISPRNGPVIVAGVEDRLVQVVRNLISNAQSFSPPGGTIAVNLHAENGVAEITVEDEGPGIPDGAEKAIFERFYRERPADEKFGTHSGLGLSICKQIVEAHGGTIRAENRRGGDGSVEGARLVVRLPRAKPVDA